MRKLYLAYLLSFVKQADWAELERPGGLSDQKIKKLLLLGLKNLAFNNHRLKSMT